MKFISSVVIGALSLGGASATSAGSADLFYHEREPIGPAIWSFGKTGISIFSIDGTKLIKSHTNMEICDGEDCKFRGAVSDGKRHIFTTNSVHSTIDVFSIDTGDFVASLDTCGSPWDLDFHPIRDEIWVHCWAPSEEEGDTGHVEVFPATSLHAPRSQVTLHDALVGHAHGSVAVDSSLGHYGFATDLNNPDLYKVDLNTRKVKDKYTFPDISGLYRMAYSQVNKHLFLRSYVCCSCGFEGADLPQCGRGGSRPVNVTSGPNQGTNLDGTCGHGCEGSPADVIGVFEYDTVAGQKVKQWQMSNGFGADPIVSPYGDYIALFGNNGGSSVRILSPDHNSLGSKLWADVEVGFTTDETSTDKSVSDAVFIQDSTHNIVIFTSTLSNSIALVDLSNKNSPTVQKLELTDAEDITSNHGRGARRNVVWAVGSNYVWVDAEKTGEFHIIKLSADGNVKNAKVVKNLPGSVGRMLLYVENYSTESNVEDMIQQELATKLALESEKNKEIIKEEVARALSGKYQNSGTIITTGEDKTIDSVGTSGLILSLIALVVGVVNIVSIRRQVSPVPKMGGTQHRVQDPIDTPSIPSQV